MPERIRSDDGSGTVLARILRKDEFPEETTFLTDPSEQLQVGFLPYEAGEAADAHTHPGVHRELSETTELVHVETGVIDVDVYDESDSLVSTVTLEAGDTAYFPAGGRGWEARTDASVIEVKQGPYDESDKREY